MRRITSKLTVAFVVTLFFGALTTAISQEKPHPIDLDALIKRGEILVNQDSRAVDLRAWRPMDGGFYIGMAIAEGHTLPGPGKDRTCARLHGRQAPACGDAVLFSVERNRNADLAKKGLEIAKADPVTTTKRNATRDALYRLGFDIGLAASEGQTLPGPGKDRIRDSLDLRLREGFIAAVTLTLERNRRK